MALDAIKQVTGVEEQAKARRAEAAAAAKKLVSDAEKTGRESLEQARREAEEYNRGLLRQAEQRAEEHQRAVLEQARRDCDALRKAAAQRLDAAAARIVGRVVNG